MVKVNVKWDSSVILVSRVPCVGEYVRVNCSTPAKQVIRVVHWVDSDMDTVADLTLED